MANTRTRRSTVTYSSYGSAALAPEYGSGAAVAYPGRQEVLTPRPKTRTNSRAAVRPEVQVREAGAVSIFAVVGFLAVGVLAVLLMMSYINLTAVTDQAAHLRSELSTLQQEEQRLNARFEQKFDMASLQAAVGDTMAKPTNEQYVYIDLSEADSVVIYGQEDTVAGPAGLLAGGKEIVENILDYFH